MNLILLTIMMMGKTIFSQEWNISIKPGAAIGLAAPLPSSRGFAYKTAFPNMLLPSIGIEFSKHNTKKKNSLNLGLILLPVIHSFEFNEKKIDVTKSYAGSYDRGEYAIQVYASLERSFKRQSNPSYKNFFSAIAGIGFNDYFFRPTFPGRGIIIPQTAMTKDGHQLTGTEFAEANYVVGAPSIFTGIRYNITNVKGNVVAVIELAGNFGIVKYFDHKITYEIDGQPRHDYLPERGVNLQFNVKIPIHTFRKKK